MHSLIFLTGIRVDFLQGIIVQAVLILLGKIWEPAYKIEYGSFFGIHFTRETKKSPVTSGGY
jgi:hypothetical protein